jgi:Leucine-rich repeat (LRR) protein
MKKLVNFSLINNKINNLSLEVSEMTKLKYLRIEGQNISELPKEMAYLTDLRTLSLNSNKFKRVPDAIRSYTKLY